MPHLLRRADCCRCAGTSLRSTAVRPSRCNWFKPRGRSAEAQKITSSLSLMLATMRGWFQTLSSAQLQNAPDSRTRYWKIKIFGGQHHRRDSTGTGRRGSVLHAGLPASTAKGSESQFSPTDKRRKGADQKEKFKGWQKTSFEKSSFQNPCKRGFSENKNNSSVKAPYSERFASYHRKLSEALPKTINSAAKA